MQKSRYQIAARLLIFGVIALFMGLVFQFTGIGLGSFTHALSGEKGNYLIQISIDTLVLILLSASILAILAGYSIMKEVI